MKTTRALSDERGVILIALLWIFTALTVIALSFSRESFMEVTAARNTRDLAEAYYIARGGINAALYMLMEKRLLPQTQQLELEAPPDPIELGHVSGVFGGGVYEVEIQDEGGKLNLNFVGEEQLQALMGVLGIDPRESGIIADSIMDWRDVDNAHRINGAEDDFYQSLNPPYRAKNGRIDTIEELLLVRGITKDYFYGHPEKSPDGSIIYRYGLSRYFTVYTTSNRVNINYAEIPVLESINGMTPEAAQQIYQRRRMKPFANLAELTKDLPVMLGPAVMQTLTTDQSGIYTLVASGRRENSKVRRVIRAVISIDPREQNRYKIIYWNENPPDL